MQLDRTDPDSAAAIVSTLCPDVDARRSWARYALESIAVASAVSPDSWAISLVQNLVRLNVGQIAVLELWAGVAVLYCCAPVRVKPSTALRPYRNWQGYLAVKAKTERWRIDASALPSVPQSLIEKHTELVRLAALSKKRTPHHGAHSPGLVTYLEKELRGVATIEEHLLPEEVVWDSYPEGAVRKVTVNAYERNPAARELCIQHYGAQCYVCGLDFGAVYGPTAQGYIHVHHLKSLSEIRTEYEVDPIADLRPVCPNCHAVIHLGGNARTIEEVRTLVETARRANPAVQRTAGQLGSRDT